MIFDHGKFGKCLKNHSVCFFSGWKQNMQTDSLHIWLDCLIKHTFIKIQKRLLVEVAVCENRVKAFHMIKTKCKESLCVCVQLGGWWGICKGN